MKGEYGICFGIYHTRIYMDKKNILIATQSLGIGGCETYIFTQCKALKKCGYNIVIAANDGALREEFEKIGVKFYDVDLFKIEENIINQIADIIKKEEISQVHIHPFYPFYNVVAACILTKVPYMLYFHGVVDIENMMEMIIGKGLNKLFLQNIVFKYASKFIYVSEECKNIIEKKFYLDKSRGILLQNSIYLSDLTSNINIQNGNVENIEKFVIVSRLDEDKLNSVKLGIEFYTNYFKKYGNTEKLKLDILGTGNALEKLKEYINTISDVNYNINLIGACKKETFETINNYDAVLGMGRCILEAIAVKKLPILISYNDYIGLIDVSTTPMEKLSYSNFSGRGIEKADMDNDLDFIMNLNSADINKIITANYAYLEKYNNLDTMIENIQDLINGIKMLHCSDICDINSYLEVVEGHSILKNDVNRCYQLYENLKKDYSIIAEQHQKDIDEVILLKEKIIKLETENEEFKNRKIYKICNKINKVLKK